MSNTRRTDMKFAGKDIYKLIPQRHPFVMVDEFEATGDNAGQSALCVRTDNYFILPDGTMAETGLIEHVAQSCSALAGSHALSGGSSAPPVGIIGEVKHFSCNRRPRSGERIETTVSFGMSFGNVTMATGKSYVCGEQIVEITLKIFMQ